MTFVLFLYNKLNLYVFFSIIFNKFIYFCRNYKQAYANLMEVRASDANMHEIKTVAGFINYKVVL